MDPEYETLMGTAAEVNATNLPASARYGLNKTLSETLASNPSSHKANKKKKLFSIGAQSSAKIFLDGKIKCILEEASFPLPVNCVPLSMCQGGV